MQPTLSHRLSASDELRLIYDISGSDTINIGYLQQDTSIGAYINVAAALGLHLVTGDLAIFIAARGLLGAGEGFFFVAAIAETKRAPFDLPEGEPEIVGYFVERYGDSVLIEPPRREK